jgi:hypothetical protein
VLLIDKWPIDVANHASRLGGKYSVMEDVSGNFMRGQLQTLPADGDARLAPWLARFAKSCIVGLSGIDARVLERLDHAQPISQYKRAGIGNVLTSLDQLLANPTYLELVTAAVAIQQTPGVRVYRWEAWNDTLEAIEMSSYNGELPSDNLARVRDRLRRVGRRSTNRIASRTLLVKGLEYDHVVIADLSKMRDPCNLYVAISRARTSVTILGASPRIVLKSGA